MSGVRRSETAFGPSRRRRWTRPGRLRPGPARRHPGMGVHVLQPSHHPGPVVSRHGSPLRLSISRPNTGDVAAAGVRRTFWPDPRGFHAAAVRPTFRSWSADCQRQRILDGRGSGLGNPEIRQSPDCHRPGGRRTSANPLDSELLRPLASLKVAPNPPASRTTTAVMSAPNAGPTATATRRQSPDPSTTRNIQTQNRGERK